MQRSGTDSRIALVAGIACNECNDATTRHSAPPKLKSANRPIMLPVEKPATVCMPVPLKVVSSGRV
jgi:hypothetical protein